MSASVRCPAWWMRRVHKRVTGTGSVYHTACFLPGWPPGLLFQMTSHSSSRSSGWGAAVWLFFWVLCEWLNVFVSRWRRQPGEPTAHSSSDEVTAKMTASHSLVLSSETKGPGSSLDLVTFWLRYGEEPAISPTCVLFTQFNF